MLLRSLFLKNKIIDIFWKSFLNSKRFLFDYLEKIDYFIFCTIQQKLKMYICGGSTIGGPCTQLESVKEKGNKNNHIYLE